MPHVFRRGSWKNFQPPTRKVCRDIQRRPGHAVYERALTDRLKQAGVKISMDGRGRAHDNIFVERLCPMVKYEEVFLTD